MKPVGFPLGATDQVVDFQFLEFDPAAEVGRQQDSIGMNFTDARQNGAVGLIAKSGFGEAEIELSAVGEIKIGRQIRLQFERGQERSLELPVGHCFAVDFGSELRGDGGQPRSVNSGDGQVQAKCLLPGKRRRLGVNRKCIGHGIESSRDQNLGLRIRFRISPQQRDWFDVSDLQIRNDQRRGPRFCRIDHREFSRDEIKFA